MFAKYFYFAVAFLISLVTGSTEIDKEIKNVIDVATLKDIAKTKPTLLAIYAPWDQNSQPLGDVLLRLSLIFNSTDLTLAKLNGEFHGGISKDLGVTEYPYIAFFNADQEEPTDILTGPAVFTNIYSFIHHRLENPTAARGSHYNIRKFEATKDLHGVIHINSQNLPKSPTVGNYLFTLFYSDEVTWFHDLVDHFEMNPRVSFATMDMKAESHLASAMNLNPDDSPQFFLLQYAEKAENQQISLPDGTNPSLESAINLINTYALDWHLEDIDVLIKNACGDKKRLQAALDELESIADGEKIAPCAIPLYIRAIQTALKNVHDPRETALWHSVVQEKLKNSDLTAKQQDIVTKESHIISHICQEMIESLEDDNTESGL